MTIAEKLERLEELMDLEGGTLEASAQLSEIEEWDSIAHLSFIVLLEDEFGKQIDGKTIRAFETVQDILNVME